MAASLVRKPVVGALFNIRTNKVVLSLRKKQSLRNKTTAQEIRGKDGGCCAKIERAL